MPHKPHTKTAKGYKPAKVPGMETARKPAIPRPSGRTRKRNNPHG